MRRFSFFILLFFYFTSFSLTTLEAQSADLLQQINFFSTFEANQNLENIRLNTYKPQKRTDFVLALSTNVDNLRDKCVVGYVTSNRLLNKLNYYKKNNYAKTVLEVKALFKKLEYNLAVIHYYTKLLSKNPNKNVKKYITIMKKKMAQCRLIQKQLQQKSGMLAEIGEWEKKYGTLTGEFR